MGMTGVADGSDPRNVFYNPAVITVGDGVAITQSYIDWGNQSVYAFGTTGSSVSLNAWDLGVSATHVFHTGGSVDYRLAGSLRFNRLNTKHSAEPRTIFLPNGTGRMLSLDSHNWYANLTVAGGITADRVDVSVGVSAKPTRVEFADKGLSGVAFDMGVMTRARLGSEDGFRVIPALGFSVVNMGEDIRDEGDGVGVTVRLPGRARLGGSVRIESPSRMGSGAPLLALTANAEVVDARDEPEDTQFFGGEISFANVVMLRAGHLPDAPEGQTTYGLGLGWAFQVVRIGFDYTRVPDFTQDETVESYGAWAVINY